MTFFRAPKIDHPSARIAPPQSRLRSGPRLLLVISAIACLTAASASASAAAAVPLQAESSAASPSGAEVPVGDLPGWKQVLREDFTGATSIFPGGYGTWWSSYNGFSDTSHKGWYDQSIISVHDGVLDLNLHTQNGVPLGAAPIPLVNGQWGGQVYGRFSVRMKIDQPLPGYGAGFLLWPDSGNWNDGEVDFPESDLGENAKGYVHCLGNASVNCTWVDSGARYTDWHTYTIDWTPWAINLLIDGNIIASNTDSVPSSPMHWVMQMATHGVTPDPSLDGHVLIDWATIYAYLP